MSIFEKEHLFAKCGQGIVLTVLLFVISLQSQAVNLHTDADSTYEKKLEQGIDAFYKTDWTRAAAIFDDLKQLSPRDSRAYFFDAMIPFWEYYFGENTDRAAELFLERSRKAIAISESQLQENPSDTTMVLMLSGLYGYQSLVAAGEKQYRTAIRSGMSGYEYTRQLLALDADDPKALIGKGLFYYMVGSVPSGLKWATNMVGMSANVDQGFDALERAAQSDSYVSNDAKMILAYLYKREKKYQKALGHLKDLTDRYPENIIFQFNLAKLHEKCEELPEARKKYRQVLTMKTDSLQALKAKSRAKLQNL